MAASRPSDSFELADLAHASREIFDPVTCGSILHDRSLEMTGPDDPLRVAVSRLWWRSVGVLPVLEGSELVGSFAEEDLLRVLAVMLQRAGATDASDDLFVWSPELLGSLRVADAMTASKELPVVEERTPLGQGLDLCCGSEIPQGRYLFVLGAGGTGAGLRLASFRDVARYLTALYDGAVDEASFATPGSGLRARAAVQQVLGRSIGAARRGWGLGHEANIVPIDCSAVDVIEAMASQRRGYVLVTQQEGSPIGICTRRDVLRICAPRFARLDSLRLSGWMSSRVRTVTGTDTLFGLFNLMGLESCRHMPLVDDWDRVEAVISMYEGVALFAGSPGRPIA